MDAGEEAPLLQTKSGPAITAARSAFNLVEPSVFKWHYS